MPPVLTVLIAARNRPDRIDRLIQSIRAQDFAEAIEILVIDDGSVPPLELADRDVQMLRNENNLGACAARNRGFAAARGEFIVMFDDDTELFDPGTLRRGIELAREHPDFAAIGFRQLRPDGTPDACQPAYSDVTCETAYFFGYGVIFRREAVLQTDGFESSFGYCYEEQDLCLQLHQAGWRVRFAPDLALLHHQDPRGRDWTRIHQLISRNAIRSMLLRFPIFSIVPCATAKWISYILESRRRGKTDWIGSIHMVVDTLRYVPYALRNRHPIAVKHLARYRRLRNFPEPLGEPQAAMV
jgi:GT2 family glycosyltransferase